MGYTGDLELHVMAQPRRALVLRAQPQSLWCGNNWIVTVIVVGAFLVMTAILVFFTWLAIQDHWSSSE